MENNNYGKRIITSAVMAMALMFITYIYIQNELTGALNDYNGHAFVYYPYFRLGNVKTGLMNAPYFLWHFTMYLLDRVLMLPIGIAACVNGCIYTLFAFLVIEWMIRKIYLHLGKEESVIPSILAFGFVVLQSISLPWFYTGGTFLGNFSMNPVHSPSFVCVRGFSFLIIALCLDIYSAQTISGYKGIFFKVEEGLKKYYILLSVFLCLSAIAKPTFAQMLIPAYGLLMLLEWISRLVKKDDAKAFFSECMKTLLCAVPTLLVVVLEILSMYLLGDSVANGSSIILTAPFAVWKMFTQNPLLSIMIGAIFPIYVFILDGDYFLKTKWGQFAVTSFVVGVLESAFLAESGNKFGHANYMWSYYSALTIIYVVALSRFIGITEEKGSRARAVAVYAGWLIFALQVLYGVLYHLPSFQ